MSEIERLRAEVERLTNGRDTMGNLWAKGKEDNERLRAALRDDPTPEQVYNACLSYRHDFGLLSVEDRKIVAFEAKEWLRAWQKTLERAALEERT
jgi:hypothetical protein